MRLNNFKSFNEGLTISPSDNISDFIKQNVKPGHIPTINDKKITHFHNTNLFNELISECCEGGNIIEALDFFIYLNDVSKGKRKLLLVDTTKIDTGGAYPGMLGYNYDESHKYYPGFYFGYNFDRSSDEYKNCDIEFYKKRLDVLSDITNSIDSIIKKASKSFIIKYKISQNSSREWWNFNGVIYEPKPIDNKIIEPYLRKWLDGEYESIGYTRE